MLLLNARGSWRGASLANDSVKAIVTAREQLPDVFVLLRLLLLSACRSYLGLFTLWAGQLARQLAQLAQTSARKDVCARIALHWFFRWLTGGCEWLDCVLEQRANICFSPSRMPRQNHKQKRVACAFACFVKTVAIKHNGPITQIHQIVWMGEDWRTTQKRLHDATDAAKANTRSFAIVSVSFQQNSTTLYTFDQTNWVLKKGTKRRRYSESKWIWKCAHRHHQPLMKRARERKTRIMSKTHGWNVQSTTEFIEQAAFKLYAINLM